MDTLDFLKKVLPDSGYYFIDTPNPGGRGFKHHCCDSIGEAAAKAMHLDEYGLTTYFACSSFRERFMERQSKDDPAKLIKVYRVQDNAKLIKAFWLDLDVGVADPMKAAKYDSQHAALVGLDGFLREAGLPKPMIVSSGYGVHVYWPLTETLLPNRWKHTANKLKALCAGLKLLADPSRTSDEASVLRPVGTSNRKNAEDPKPVTLLLDADPIDPTDFEKRIERSLKAHGLLEPVAKGAPTGVNPAGLTAPNDYPDSYPETIADNCSQVKLLRDKGGDIPEPVWYAAIQVLHFAKNGDDAIHKWSSPYAGYSRDETNHKIHQIASMGPTSCATFELRNESGCKGCPFKGKIVSPIQLGIRVEEAAAPVVTQLTSLGEIKVEIPPPPTPFKRTTTGLYIEQDGVPLRFYRYDLFPISLIWDDADSHMTVGVRHQLPQEGWQDFSFPASELSSLKDFETMFAGQGVFPDKVPMMKAYMMSYLQNLQNTIKMQRLYNSLGWKDDTNFVLGKRIFTSHGIFHAGLSRTVPETVVRGIESKGDLSKWTEAVSQFTRPGLEAHLFAICTGFGSPLLSLTGFAGCLVSMLGESNAGKTLAARAALTIYGKFEDLQSGAIDTMNARMERLNAMANLPIYFDELTNLDAKDLSSLVYMLSQGRGREKLRSDSSTRAAAHWSAIALGSTNRSMYDILAQGKDNIEAEMMRVLEIWVPRHAWFEPDMSGIYDALKNNYGLAGDHYVKHIVANREQIAKQIRLIIESLNKATGFEGKERFWSSMSGCVLYGFTAACQLGLIKPRDFQATFKRMFEWIRDTIIGLRGEVKANAVDEVGCLGQYINHYQAGTLVVYPVQMGAKEAMAIRKRPTRELVMRVEEDKSVLWIDRKHIRAYMGAKQINYDKARRFLTDAGVVLSCDDRKMLGGGTSEFRSAQIPCWRVDLKAPGLEHAVAELTEGGESLPT